jgi:predicted metal-dependent peptidase
MAKDPIETKLAAARTRLILDKPFLGALVLRLPLEEGDPAWCRTTATDARAFYYNREVMAALTLEETKFMLAHEALHCALSHFARRMHRSKHRWDLACDLAINPLLKDDGLKPPPGMLIIDDYRGMTAEEIYPLLEEDDQRETFDDHLYDRDESGGSGQGETPKPRGGGGFGDRQREPSQGEGPGTSQGRPAPKPLSPEERETLAIQWQQRMAGAAQQALQAGRLSGALGRMIDHLLQPQLPWRMVLARFLSSTARDDYSYMRPSRREGEYILPSLRSHQIDIVVAIDTSGSVKEDELNEFMAEVNALKGQIRARVTLLPCDEALPPGAHWVFEPWEEFRLPQEIQGGGNTDFRPVFDWVERHGLQPETLVYFTDADGRFPDRPPPYPVVWLVKGKRTPPWGERVQLN